MSKEFLELLNNETNELIVSAISNKKFLQDYPDMYFTIANIFLNKKKHDYKLEKEALIEQFCIALNNMISQYKGSLVHKTNICICMNKLKEEFYDTGRINGELSPFENNITQDDNTKTV